MPPYLDLSPAGLVSSTRGQCTTRQQSFFLQNCACMHSQICARSSTLPPLHTSIVRSWGFSVPMRAKAAQWRSAWRSSASCASLSPGFPSLLPGKSYLSVEDSTEALNRKLRRAICQSRQIHRNQIGILSSRARISRHLPSVRCKD